MHNIKDSREKDISHYLSYFWLTFSLTNSWYIFIFFMKAIHFYKIQAIKKSGE